MFNGTFRLSAQIGYSLYRAIGDRVQGQGTQSKINKPNKRKIHTKTLFHLGFVDIISSPHEGVTVIRGIFLSLASTDN